MPFEKAKIYTASETCKGAHYTIPTDLPLFLHQSQGWKQAQGSFLWAKQNLLVSENYELLEIIYSKKTDLLSYVTLDRLA